MTAEAQAEIGHNNPPDTDFSDLRDEVNEFGQAAEAWGRHGVNDAGDAEKMNDFISGARRLYKRIDEARVTEKKPHDEAAAAVQAKYKPLLTSIEKAAAAAKTLLTSYMQRLEREQAEQRRREAEEAAKAEAEARAKAEAAQESGDMVGATEAEEAAKAAAKQAAKASDPKSSAARVGSASGSARSMGMRTVREAKISNLPLALAHYKKHPKIEATILEIANAEIRASKGEEIEIPGVEIVETRRVA